MMGAKKSKTQTCTHSIDVTTCFFLGRRLFIMIVPELQGREYICLEIIIKDDNKSTRKL